MCLLIFAYRALDQYPLVVAANRDEFHQRQTSSSGFWPQHPGLLAGKDEQLGGTWMGVTRDGKFAAVTNFRDPSATKVAPRSRGELPLAFLCGQQEPEPYLQALRPRAMDYAGFNLLLGDTGSLWYFSNSLQHGLKAPAAPRPLKPGVYGLSNAYLDTPWPKVERGKKLLKDAVINAQSINHESLLQLVNGTELADQDTLQSMGLGTQMEQLLSAQFIRSREYGTRSSTTFWRDSEGGMSWQELSYEASGAQIGSQLEDFRLIT